MKPLFYVKKLRDFLMESSELNKKFLYFVKYAKFES